MLLGFHTQLLCCLLAPPSCLSLLSLPSAAYGQIACLATGGVGVNWRRRWRTWRRVWHMAWVFLETASSMSELFAGCVIPHCGSHAVALTSSDRGGVHDPKGMTCSAHLPTQPKCISDLHAKSPPVFRRIRHRSGELVTRTLRTSTVQVAHHSIEVIATIGKTHERKHTYLLFRLSARCFATTVHHPSTQTK